MPQNKKNSQDSAQVLYKERVVPGFGTFAPLLAIFPAVLLALYPISPTLGVVLGAALTGGFVSILFARSPKICLSKGLLQVGSATLPVEVIARVRVIAKEECFSERGPKLDARAFYVFQGSVKTSLKVFIEDGNDPTPYWLFSSRRPEVLQRLLAK